MDLPDSVPVDGPLEAFDIVHTYIARGEQPEGELPGRMDPRPFVNAYDAGIAEVDHKLGETFERWRSTGRLDRSIVVVTSDHGESMLEQHRFFGHATIGSAVTRVPFLVRLPGGERGGERVHGRVQTLDIVPTLLERCGFGLEGRALGGLPLLAGTSPGSLAERTVLTEHGSYEQQALESGPWRLVRHEPAGDPLAARLSSPLMDPEWRRAHFPETLDGLTREDGVSIALRFPSVEALRETLEAGFEVEHVALHDLLADPLEIVDLAAEEPEVAETLLAELERRIQAIGELREKGRPSEALPGLTEDDLEQLRAIGYVEPERD